MLQLGHLEAKTTKNILIPFGDSPHGDVALVGRTPNVCELALTTTQAHLDLSYTAADGQVSRLVDTQKVRVALPLTVNVQDFFRPEW